MVIFRSKLAKIIMVLILTGIVLLLYEQSHFRIVSTDPAASKITAWTPYFKINLNKDVAASGTMATTVPDIVYNHKITAVGKTVTVYLSVPLDTTKTYIINLQSISSASGQKLTNKSFSFKPVPASRDSIPEDQKEALIQRNEQSAVYKDPILAYLPYHSVDFSLESSFNATANNQPQLVLLAKLLIHRAQSGDMNAAITGGKQEVADYIKSLGLDPAKYTIQYSTVGP